MNLETVMSQLFGQPVLPSFDGVFMLREVLPMISFENFANAISVAIEKHRNGERITIQGIVLGYDQLIDMTLHGYGVKVKPIPGTTDYTLYFGHDGQDVLTKVISQEEYDKGTEQAMNFYEECRKALANLGVGCEKEDDLYLTAANDRISI